MVLLLSFDVKIFGVDFVFCVIWWVVIDGWRNKMWFYVLVDWCDWYIMS